MYHYAIGVFDKDLTDFVPLNWLACSIDVTNIEKLVEENTIVQCYWPSYKAPSSVSLAKKRLAAVEVHWSLHRMRLLGVAGTIFLLILLM